MKNLMFGLLLATGLGLVGCEKSFNAEVQDVRETEKQAMENIKDKERELQDTKIDETQKVIKERRDVEDAARDPNRVEPAPVVVP